MHLLDTGTRTGAFNMELDEMLARRMHEEGGPPILRLFRWQPWAISIGYNQRVDDLDAAHCRRDGIDIVRRPTGGRALLHAEELTYSVVMCSGRRGILEVYNHISRALVRGLQLFGVDVTLQKSQPNFQEAYRNTSSIPCFTSSARYEIEWQGRKLVGSAQRRFGDGGDDVVLQHGSILCGPAHRRLVDYLAIKEPSLIYQVRQDMATKTVDLGEILNRAVDIAKLSDCIERGFELEWGVEIEPMELSPVLSTQL